MMNKNNPGDNKLKHQNIKVVTLNDFDNLVKNTYGKPYCLQQQDGCLNNNSIILFEAPNNNEYGEDYLNDTIPFEINGEERGVSFKAWLEADPKQHGIDNNWTETYIRLFWHRNFYPNLQHLVNDLFKKGLIDKGEYLVQISW